VLDTKPLSAYAVGSLSLKFSERKKSMIRALLVVSVLLLKFGVFTKVDTAKALNHFPEPHCPWPAPPDCEC